MIRTKLKKRYGKLTVLGYFTRGGRGMAKCRCTCGDETEVRTSNLLSGATSSCGKPQCRDIERVTKDKNYVPYGSRAMSEKKVRQLWDLYHDKEKALSVGKIAKRLRVNPNTAYSTLRAIRRTGGLDAYFGKVA